MDKKQKRSDFEGRSPGGGVRTELEERREEKTIQKEHLQYVQGEKRTKQQQPNV